MSLKSSLIFLICWLLLTYPVMKFWVTEPELENRNYFVNFRYSSGENSVMTDLESKKLEKSA